MIFPMYTAAVAPPSDSGQRSFGRMTVSGLTVVIGLEGGQDARGVPVRGQRVSSSR